jgi:hypothetical protein
MRNNGKKKKVFWIFMRQRATLRKKRKTEEQFINETNGTNSTPTPLPADSPPSSQSKRQKNALNQGMSLHVLVYAR